MIDYPSYNGYDDELIPDWTYWTCKCGCGRELARNNKSGYSRYCKDKMPQSKEPVTADLKERSMNKIVVTKQFVGICHMQVCAQMDSTDEEILEVCNSENPSGTTNGWSSVIRNGDGAPVQCADDHSRLHFLVAC